MLLVFRPHSALFDKNFLISWGARPGWCIVIGSPPTVLKHVVYAGVNTSRAPLDAPALLTDLCSVARPDTNGLRLR
jgi:hypothetical protein